MRAHHDRRAHADDADSVVKYEIVDVVTATASPAAAWRSPPHRRALQRARGRGRGEGGRDGGVEGRGHRLGRRRVPRGMRHRGGADASASARGRHLHRLRAGGSHSRAHARKIRNSNSYALAACAQAAGAVPVILPIVEDTKEALAAAVSAAADAYDFVVTSGGASNGDFDFIKPWCPSWASC